MSSPLTQLRDRLAELADLRNAGHLMHWDQQTMMPRRGGQARADALATLERISHAMFVSEETGTLIESAAGELDGADPDSDDARLIKVTRRRFEKARHVPTELAAELAHAASVGQEAWVKARAASDFSAFAPYLEHNLELQQRYVACFEDGFDCAYDVLLDDYDPGMKSSDVANLFEQLRGELVPLIADLRQREIDDSCLHGHFPVERQRALVADVVELMGFDRSGWRLDDAVHPFATSFGSSDVRITTRWDDSFFASALYGAMHECGHGLYEAGIDVALQRTPLGHGESLSIHESQSRLWENMVGRSSAFTNFLAPRIAASFDGSSSLAPETLFRAVNKVSPSFIRVEADEATYGLHIVLRFELEQDLIEGRLPVAQLPDAWNAKVEEYLGLEVRDDADGVLQDVHWSAGLLGYFPTYALGNLVAGSLWARARADLPELEQSIAVGELGSLRDWLREHVHRHGAKFTTRELLERVDGQPLSVEPFVEYLKEKLADVYRV